MSDAIHRVQVRFGESVVGVRARIEHMLGVTTEARAEGPMWAIYFTAPRDVDLDFLRPDVLPPKSKR